MDAEVLAEVSSRTYSAYAAGKDSARGARFWACPSWPGSKSAARRVAARRRARGSEEGLDAAVREVENGSGAGSGQARDWVVKLFGGGIWNVGSSRSCVLRCSSLIGRRALVRNSFTDLVWL